MLRGFGRRRGEGLGRFGNVSEGLGGYGMVWEVWKGLGGFGRVWGDLGRFEGGLEGLAW